MAGGEHMAELEAEIESYMATQDGAASAPAQPEASAGAGGTLGRHRTPQRKDRLRGINGKWVDACATDDIEEELIRFDHEGRTFAIYRSPDDEFFCTDGLCTHEKVHLSDGLVMDNTIECPKHNGMFDYRTGEALRAPVCVNLKTYRTKVEDGRVFIEI